MNKIELIKLTKELLNETDLSKREEDLLYLKKEYKFLSHKEENSFYDQEQTKTFISLYLELAKKDPKLVQSGYDEKKEIIELTKALLNREDIVKASKDLDNYIDSFKKAEKCSKEQDDELWAEFRKIKDEFIAKKKAYFENLDKQNKEKKQKKEEIINKAKELLVIKNVKEANEKMDALMNEWKKIGYSGKDNDQQLWEQFLAVRKEFQTKKKEHHNEMLKTFEERAIKKEEMIKNFKKFLMDADFSEEEVRKVKKMREEFIKIGFAGKDKDDILYKKFNEVMNQYFEDKKFYSF